MHNLEQRIATIDEALTRLNALTETGMENVCLAYRTGECRDLTELKFESAATQVMESSLKCLALMAPVASDLRFAMTALRIGQDYEKMFDLLASMIERAGRLAPIQQHPSMTSIAAACEAAEMYLAVLAQCHVGVRGNAWEAIEGAAGSSAALANLRIQELKAEILTMMEDQTVKPELKIDLVLSSRHIKRIVKAMDDIMDEWRTLRHS